MSKLERLALFITGADNLPENMRRADSRQNPQRLENRSLTDTVFTYDKIDTTEALYLETLA
jgi:hypothetical protein